MYLSVYNGSSWGAEIALPPALSNRSPAVACPQGGGDVTVFWTSTSGKVSFENYFGGTLYAAGTVPGAVAITGPSATTFAGLTDGFVSTWPVVAWTAVQKGAHVIEYAVARGGTFGAVSTLPAAKTNVAPAIGTFPFFGRGAADLTLYAAWEGQAGDTLWYDASNAP